MKISQKSAWLLVSGFVAAGVVAYVVYAVSPAIVYGKGGFVAADVRALDAQLGGYKKLNGAYPTTAQGLRALGAFPKDPWSNDYVYRYPGKRYPDGYDLFSAGPDRMPDTADDEWGR
jgi:general secretion pathway protein G